MTATIEADIVRSILVWLETQSQSYAVNVWGNALMVSGTPDILGCYRGRMLVIEVKRTHPRRMKLPPLRLSARAEYFWRQGATLLQAVQLERWEQAGALALVAISLDEVKAALVGMEA